MDLGGVAFLVTDSLVPGHKLDVVASLTLAALPTVAPAEDACATSAALAVVELPAFDDLFVTEMPFVWRNLRRLGVAQAQLDDATQDVFLVVHRRTGGQLVTSVRGWLFGILRRVASDYRRQARRKGTTSIEVSPEPVGVDGHAAVERAEAARLVQAALEQLPEDRRFVFMLAELEQLAAPAIAAALGIPLNTVYSRLRVARQEFERQVQRLSADRVQPDGANS